MQFMNPTGRGIRNDAGGAGYFGAPRGNRLHKGTDYIAQYIFKVKKGQEIWMPVGQGEIARTSLPYKNDLKWRGVYIFHPRIELQMWYLEPVGELIRAGPLEIGTVIGHAQNIGEKYPDVTPHIHLQIVRIDPTIVFPLEYSEFNMEAPL